MRLQLILLLPFALSHPFTPSASLTSRGRNETIHGTQLIAGITLPSTPLISKALDFAHDTMDNQTYNHVLRSWINGIASLSHLPRSLQESVDVEAISIAAILHDLGWVKSNKSDTITLDKRFEVDGANDARKFLLREGRTEEWDKHRIQLVWDAIALHTTRDINVDKEPEVWLTSNGYYSQIRFPQLNFHEIVTDQHLSIFAELFGPNKSAELLGSDRVAVTQGEWEAINTVYPRTDFRKYFRGVFIWLCTIKPATTYQNWQGDYGEAFVEGYNRTGYRVIDVSEEYLLE